MNWNQKKQKYLDRRIKKLYGQKKKNKQKKKHNALHTQKRKNEKNNDDYVVVTAPINFSVYDNHEEVTEYLTNLYNMIIQGKRDEKIYFEFGKVNKVSIESIVYIIALLKNVRTKPYLHYTFKGDFPENDQACTMFKESGFLNYVRSNSSRMPKCIDRIQILSGDTIDTKDAKQICDFAIETGMLNIRELRVLYRTLIELMSNTVQHAFNNSKKNKNLIHAWYLYCQAYEDKLIFNFVDIGDGIPKTIRNKNMLEKLTIQDSQAIMSALNGEFRSETNLISRGKGLPLIKTDVENRILKNFKVVSEQGCCMYDDINNDFREIEYKNGIFGTIFYWEMGRRKLV